MAVLDSKKAYKSLKKKGFVDSPSKSDDHLYLEFFYGNKLYFHTKLSHNHQDLGDFLIKQMSMQCKLNKSDFTDLVNCPLSLEAYIEKLSAQGIIEKMDIPSKRT